MFIRLIKYYIKNTPVGNCRISLNKNNKGWRIMSFLICYSSIKEMLELCKKIKSREATKQDVENMLKHEDYKFELDRYKGKISEKDYIDYLLKADNLTEDEVENKGLKTHHKYYKDLFSNLNFYMGKLKELEDLLAPELFEEQMQVALSGLPDGLILPEIKFVFTIGLGQSFGYVHQNGTHFDFLQLSKEKSLIDFCSTISHEIHHVGINTIHDSFDIQNMPLEELFYLYFSGEGLAVKYCNNAVGILSKSINEGEKNIGLDSFTWNYLNADFDNTMKQFKATINDIRNNSINSMEELDKHIWAYWMNFHTSDQDNSEIPKLLHSRLYSFGNEIWGVIHDCFGKKVVYEVMNNLKSFPEVFNSAVERIGFSQYKIDLKLK